MSPVLLVYIPVSYTHLDVYKRQVLVSTKNSLYIIEGILWLFHRNIEATAVELSGFLRGILLVSPYNKPPKAEVLDINLNTLFWAHRKVILAGDLNCKTPRLGSHLITAIQRALHRYLRDHDSGPMDHDNRPTTPALETQDLTFWTLKISRVTSLRLMQPCWLSCFLTTVHTGARAHPSHDWEKLAS